MITELLLAILIGCLAGTFTGLTPGIHVNLIAVILLSSAPFLLEHVTLEAMIIFIVSMSITHTFVNTIPSIFLGAPDPGTALSVLPGHRMLLNGEGFEAVKLTIIGSLLGLILSFSLYLGFEKILVNIYPLLQSYIGELLFVVSLFIIFGNDKPFSSTLVYVLAGLLGLAVLNSRMENSLFPLLSGLFGVSTLLFSLKEKNSVPEQKITDKTDFDIKKGVLSGFLGTLSGFITAVLPGLGSSTAAAISSSLKKDSDTKNFLVMIGSISTVNFFMSIAALNVIGKARNGAIIAIMELNKEPSVMLLLFGAMISGGISVFVALRVAKKFLLLMKKINYDILAKSIIFLLLILTFFLSGFTGFFALIVATALGLYANFKGVPRNTMMACIMIPVMSYFLF